jgi:hypothetical protein
MPHLVDQTAQGNASEAVSVQPRLLDNPPPERDELQQMRHERFYQRGKLWFFRTREGFDIGPYSKRADAVDAADRLSQLHERADRRLTTA